MEDETTSSSHHKPDPVSLDAAIDLSQISLRPLRLSDADDFMVWATDEKVTKFCTWDPYTSRDDAVNFIANVATQFLWFRAICLNDRAIGSISVCSYAGGDKCRGKSGEIGYVLGSKYWGKGIATKAVKESVGVVFDEMRELERVEALVDVENVRSQRVLQKCGFQREGVLRKYLFVKGKSRDRVMFSILSSEFGRETEIEGGTHKK